MASEKKGYGFMGPVLAVMVLALVLAFAAFVLDLASKVSRGPFTFASEGLFMNTAILGTGFLVGVLVFYSILKESVNFAVRIAVALFVFSAIMSLLIYLKLLFTYYGFSSPLLHFSLTFIAYFCGFLGVMAIFDVLSAKWRNMLFAVCSGTVGAFIGALLPIVAVILILIVFSALDIVLIRRGTVSQAEKITENYEELVVMKMSYSSKNFAIGLADLICYAMLVAGSFSSFGIISATSSLILVMVGAFVASREARRVTQVPGLPLSVGLGLIPVLAYMVFPGLP